MSSLLERQYGTKTPQESLCHPFSNKPHRPCGRSRFFGNQYRWDILQLDMGCRLFGYGVPAHACFSRVIRRGGRIRACAPPKDWRKDKYLLSRSHRSLLKRNRVSGGLAHRYCAECLPPALATCCLQKTAWWTLAKRNAVTPWNQMVDSMLSLSILNTTIYRM